MNKSIITQWNTIYLFKIMKSVLRQSMKMKTMLHKNRPEWPAESLNSWVFTLVFLILYCKPSGLAAPLKDMLWNSWKSFSMAPGKQFLPPILLPINTASHSRKWSCYLFLENTSHSHALTTAPCSSLLYQHKERKWGPALSVWWMVIIGRGDPRSRAVVFHL